MGLFPHVQQMLIDENKRRPIVGDLLLIGRQDIKGSSQSDAQFFASFCAARVQALDVSDFEGAEIIHNLCDPLPPELFAIADFIVDGSCLDNIWDPAQALRSMSAMLRPGGRMLLCEHGTMCKGAFTAMSPEWFWDFFAANDYLDCQVNIAWLRNKGDHKYNRPDLDAPWTVGPWVPFNTLNQPHWSHPKDNAHFMVVTLAEKRLTEPRSTNDRIPMQAQYRVKHSGGAGDIYLKAYRRFSQSERAR